MSKFPQLSAKMQGSLEIQHKIFSEMISITNEIIEQQLGIKETTESLLDKNKLLQMKSGELNQVLETSQRQLQTMTTIPIELINELANAVRRMKEDQQEKFEELLKLLEDVHKKTDKQKYIATGSTPAKVAPTKLTGHQEPVCNGVVAWVKPQKSTSRASSHSSTASPHLTILNSCDGKGSDSPHCEDPASQSETVEEKEVLSENNIVEDQRRQERKSSISTQNTNGKK